MCRKSSDVPRKGDGCFKYLLDNYAYLTYNISTVVKGQGEAKALEKGASQASSTDIGFGLYRAEQASETGKERSQVSASTDTKSASVNTGIDTSTGALATSTKPKTEEGAVSSGFDLGKIINVVLYIGIIVFIFMMVRKG